MRRVLIVLCVLCLWSCDRNSSIVVGFEGTVTDDRNGVPMSGVDVEVLHQVLSGGSLNSSFQTAAQTNTDGSGQYSLEFERENSLEYKMVVEKENYFTKTFFINPENVVPSEKFQRSTSMIAKAEMEVRVASQNPFDDDDIFRFRFVDTSFNCDCCDNEWKVFLGTEIDSTFKCSVYGDLQVDYMYEIERNGEMTTETGFFYCPAFEVSNIEILY